MNSHVAHPENATTVVDDVTFRADCAKLVGRLFYPSGPAKAAIVLHGATGVPHRYYRHFANWLAAQGYACLTYDYRDFGASAHRHLKHSNATMADWGVKDQAAAQRYMEQLMPDAPLWVIGHSLGGMMLPFQDGAARVERLITVASGHVHTSDHPWPYKALALAFWYGHVPLATLLMGYMPGAALRIGADIPAPVYWQWRRWCTTRGFILGEVGHSLPVPDWKAFTGRAKFVAVADDDLTPPPTVWRAMQVFPEAYKRQLTLKPADFGLKNIGHIGAFKQGNAAIWAKILAE